MAVIASHRPRVKPARKSTPPARTLSYNPATRLLTLTVGKLRTVYRVEVLHHDFGADTVAVRLVKTPAPVDPGEPDHYDVTCHRTARRHTGEPVGSCECLGMSAHGRCKHLHSIAKLLSLALLFA